MAGASCPVAAMAAAAAAKASAGDSTGVAGAGDGSRRGDLYGFRYCRRCFRAGHRVLDQRFDRVDDLLYGPAFAVTRPGNGGHGDLPRCSRNCRTLSRGDHFGTAPVAECRSWGNPVPAPAAERSLGKRRGLDRFWGQVAGVYRDLFYGTGNLDLLFLSPGTGVFLPGLPGDRHIRRHIRRVRYCCGDIFFEAFHPFVSLAPALAGSLPDKAQRHLAGIRRIGQDGKRDDRVADCILPDSNVPYGDKRDLLCRDNILLAVDDNKTTICEHQFERHGFYLDMLCRKNNGLIAFQIGIAHNYHVLYYTLALPLTNKYLSGIFIFDNKRGVKEKRTQRYSRSFI